MLWLLIVSEVIGDKNVNTLPFNLGVAYPYVRIRAFGVNPDTYRVTAVHV